LGDLPQNLDYNYAASLKGHLANELAEKKSILIDCGETERLSMGCAQLLLAAQKKAQDNDIEFKIKASSAVQNILQDLGLIDLFNIEKEE